MEEQVQALKPGHIYEFRTKDWVAPDATEVVPGQRKRRIFIGHAEVEGIPFVEVQRESGKRHLLAVEALESIRQVDRFR